MTKFGLKMPSHASHNAVVWVRVDSTSVTGQLLKDGYAKRGHGGRLYGCGVKHLVNLSHDAIVLHYNRKWQGIIASKVDASTLTDLGGAHFLLTQSLGYTLQYKYKLGGLKRVLAKFGFGLNKAGAVQFGPLMKDLAVWLRKNPSVAPMPGTSSELYQKAWVKALGSELFGPCVVCGEVQAEVHFCRVTARKPLNLPKGMGDWTLTDKAGANRRLKEGVHYSKYSFVHRVMLCPSHRLGVVTNTLSAEAYRHVHASCQAATTHRVLSVRHVKVSIRDK